MKARFKFKFAFRFLLGGNSLITWIITVLLSAFSFMLFSLSSIGFTYNEVDRAAKGYLNYCSDIGYIPIYMSNNTNLTKEQIDLYEQTTGLSFVYMLGFSTTWRYFLGIQNERMCLELLNQYLPNGHSYAVAGAQQDYEALGYTLLAGRYPTQEYEIAISEVNFQVWQDVGYVDAAKYYEWYEMDIGDLYHIEGYEYKEPSTYEVIPISDYEDIIGKTIGRGDIETDEHAYAYTIVGVVDTHYSIQKAEELRRVGYCPFGNILYSEEKKQEAKEGDRVRVICCSSNIPYSAMKKMVQLNLTLRSEAVEYSYPAVDQLVFFLHTDDFSSEVLLSTIFAVAGVFFGFFAVLLNGHLVTLSIERNQKQIGILRAMGAGEKTIVRLYLIGALLLAAVIYLLAQIAALVFFYGWISPLFYIEYLGFHLIIYNYYHVLMLLAICIAVPLLSTIAPLKKFFRKPIVDNITGNAVKRKNRNRA